MNKEQRVLEEHRIKPTFERLSILKYLTSHSGHPSAGVIYSTIKEKIPTISKTTVYNTLKTFIKNDVICSFSGPDGEIHYDIQTTSHYHLYCKVCKKFYNLNLNCPRFENTTIEGHKIENFHGYFTGICKKCLEDL
ncbi:MAG: transcriptional repressor [Candidatus Cloacimonadota bacterium]|nr:transcriptional repressor [Candidatus Cloacimonadota bacterium]